MKPNIHPKTHTVSLTLTDGSEVLVQSTYGKEGDKILLDIDPLKHPAWNKDAAGYINEKAGNVAKYNAKFGGLRLGAKSED